jgi:hypothetical protein
MEIDGNLGDGRICRRLERARPGGCVSIRFGKVDLRNITLPFVDKTFRTLTDRDHRAANGMLDDLVQSRWFPEASEIELLPALPQQWQMEPCG